MHIILYMHESTRGKFSILLHRRYGKHMEDTNTPINLEICSKLFI